MADRRPRKIDFDRDVVDGRSSLEAYIAIAIDFRWVELILGGERVEIKDILRDEAYPEWGFKRGVLPDHIKNVSINEDKKDQFIISYDRRLNHEIERDYWEHKGFSTNKKGRSIQVINPNGEVIATYSSSRIYIEEDCINQFLENMR